MPDARENIFMFENLNFRCLSKFQKFREPLSNNVIVRFLGIFIISLIMVTVLQAQNDQTEPILGFSGEPLSCDDGVAFHDLIVTEALEKMKENSFLFILVSQGNRENSDELLQRRIHNIRQYFRDRGSRLSSKRIIIATGQSLSGKGQLEYYINGELYLRLLYPKNGYICHSCCGPDKNYYPDKEIYETNKRKRIKKSK